MSPSRHRLLTVWAVCCIVAALLLAGFCFLDTVFAGRSLSDADPFPYARADAVQYGLTGFRYFYRGHLLTGPHIGYPVVLLALLVNLALLWLARGWGSRARRMFRVNAWALGLTLGLGWPVLQVAQWSHNAVLSRVDIISVRATPVHLYTTECQERIPPQCTRLKTVPFPDPVAWGVVGLALVGGAGLVPAGRRQRMQNAPAW